MLRAIVSLLLATLLLAPPLRAQQAPPWRLVPADGIATQTHLILTVPLAEPDALSAVAAEIEARFDVTLTAEWPLQSLSVHCLVVDTAGTPDLDALIARMQADAQIRTVQRMNDFQVFEVLYRDPLLPMSRELVGRYRAVLGLLGLLLFGHSFGGQPLNARQCL